MSNPIDLSVQHSLELLEKLRQTCSEFTQKEEQLTRDLALRRNTFSRKQREANEMLESKHSRLIAQINSTFEAAEEKAAARFEKRKDRFTLVAEKALRNLPSLAEAAKQRWRADLQMQHFFAGRKQEEGVAAAEATLAEATSKLTQAHARLNHLITLTQKAFRGYLSHGRTLRAAFEAKTTNSEKQAPPEKNATPDMLEEQLDSIQDAFNQFRRLPFPRFFSFLPLPVILILVVAGAGIATAFGPSLCIKALIWAGILSAAAFVLHQIGFIASSDSAKKLALLLAQANQLHSDCCAAADHNFRHTCRQIAQEHDQTAAGIQLQWDRAPEIEAEFETKARQKLEGQMPRIATKIENCLTSELERLDSQWDREIERVNAETEAARSRLASAKDAGLAEITEAELAQWKSLQQQWEEAIVQIYQTINSISNAVAPNSQPWSPAFVQDWSAPVEATSAVPFARLDLSLGTPANPIPKNPLLALPGPAQISIPLSLTFPLQGSILFETRSSGDPTLVGALNNIMLRLLTGNPAGKLAFTIIDPVGLGQNFAGLMHLSDYEESLINRKIWTQRDGIEERLIELSEHIEKVIQMYLRNEYESITEYNAQAGSVAEKYHFLIIADFPANFSETTIKRLQSIATTGPRCGIYTLIHWDQRQQAPDGLVPEELRRNSLCIRCEGDQLVISPFTPSTSFQIDAGTTLRLDPPPTPEVALALVHKIGQSSIDSNRVEVPFVQIAPKPEARWTLQTTHELRVPIGRTGATKFQELAIGKGTRQHALFAGKTGSGKSTLFHVIITNLALSCSPDQVEFYLIDFKKGVEFKCYATKRLPHARVVAIESDREFALSVLQRVDEELKRRGDLFRKLGVQDVAGYKRTGATDPLPRTLLIIDEFQEFFVEDDTIAQTASLLFDRIVRQGRAFGIHVLLGSQTLGGAYSLARATLGQMVIRVALQCNEADAYLIMDDNNSAPRLLSRPGEGIYNDSAGAVEGNSPFQVVWLPDAERDGWLDIVQDLALQTHREYPSPIVFEGNAPANVLENDLLLKALASSPEAATSQPRAWIGAPNSIKGPTEVVFEPHSGSNLLIIGQREESSLTMLGLTLLALGAQFPVGAAQFVLFHCNAPGSPDANYLEAILGSMAHEVTVVQNHNLAATMNEIAGQLKERSSNESSHPQPVFIFIHGLQKFKKLRNEQDFSFSLDDTEASPGAQFNELICEGASHGMHLIATIDTFNNINRCMSRKALSEFEMRVLFQMSASDSASLIDSPKASTLGLHRALFYNEQQGHIEVFRPYAQPPLDWLKSCRPGGPSRPSPVTAKP